MIDMRYFQRRIADIAEDSANGLYMMSRGQQLTYSYGTTSDGWKQLVAEPRWIDGMYLTPSQDLRHINTTSQDFTINFDLEYLNTEFLFGEDDAPDDNIVTGDIEDILQSDGEL